MSLYAELKRRNVIRMAALYLVTAWLLVQVAATLLPVFGAPAWVMKTLVGFFALAFVPVLVFSWVYELTPQGLKRDAEVPQEQSIAPQTGRRMDRLIVAGLVAVIAMMAVERIWFAQRAGDAAPDASAETATDPASKPQRNPDIASESPTRLIAVLPFVNLSADPEQEYFSDGMTEEILNSLARIEAFTVTSRTSSFHFKDKDQPLPQIAKALGVDYVLEGSVRKAGAQVRITAQLIRVAGDGHLWSDSWTRDLADVFVVQEDIARHVARELQARLTPGDEARLARVGTRDPAAYQDFLRARNLWSQRSVASLNAAVDAFQAALARDPGFADAWAGLAQTWALLPEYTGISVDNQDWVAATYAQALDAAGRALALDPASSRALAARAYVLTVHFDWVKAEADFRAALAADPRDAGARQWYGELLAYQRRSGEALAQYDVALALDPLAPILQASHGSTLALQGRPADAILSFEQALRLAPAFGAGLPVHIYALAEVGQFDRALELAAGMPVENRLYVEAKRDPSRTEAAVQSILAQGLDMVIGKPLLLASLGRHDLALVELEHLFALGDPYRVQIYHMKAFDPLHADPRFQALLAQIGLPRPPAPAAGGDS